MVEIVFTKPFLKPHVNYKITIIDINSIIREKVNHLKKKGYEIVEINKI